MKAYSKEGTNYMEAPKKKKKLTHPVIFLFRQNSTSLQQLSSYTFLWCSETSRLPADDVKTILRTVPALRHAFMMLNTPFTVGFITSFCTTN